jgi:hypothetical protein
MNHEIIQPFLMLVAGMVIAFLVSFKSEEPVKEYATLSYYPDKSNPGLIFTSESDVKITNNAEGTEELLIKTLNILAQKGWKLNAAESIVKKTNLDVVSGTNYYTYRVQYMERVKP